MTDIESTHNTLRFTVPMKQYNDRVLDKCFYWYGKDYNVNITENDPDYVIELSTINGEILHQESLVHKINRDLNDFRLRDIVASETKNIRELLIAKAFSHYQDDDPETDISDPVGFNPHAL